MFSKGYTLNFDGSHNNQANKAGAGFIIRDDKGDLMLAGAYNLIGLPHYNVTIAEATGLMKGVQMAREHRFKLNLIKGDNKDVIDLILGRARWSPEPVLNDIILETKSMINLASVEVKLINREDNKVADKLASMGTSQRFQSKVFTRFDSYDLPSQVTELIKLDKLSSTTNETNYGEASSLASDIGVAGAAVAGIAMLGWGLSKLFSGESSSTSREQSFTSKAVEAQKYLENLSNTFTNNSQNSVKSWDVLTNNSPNSPKRRLGFFTLQYFGSDRNQLQKARAGCIITNSGEFIVAGAYNLDNQYPDCNVAVAEAIALLKGLILAKRNNVKLDLIQGRNVEVRDRVFNREVRPPKSPELISLIGQIKANLHDQEIDMEEAMELVEEGDIAVARALATEGGTLKEESVIYDSVHGLPPRVALVL